MSGSPPPTVFVLDDDAAIQDSLRQLLTVMRFPAEFFTSVDEYWAAYDPRRLGCLLLDLRLPGDGFSVLQRFADEGHGLPTLVITGHGDEETKAKAFELGAVGFFEKPFNIRVLCDAIRKTLHSDNGAD